MLRSAITATLLVTAISHSVHATDAVPVTIAKDIHDGFFRRALAQLRPLMDSHVKEADFQYQYGTALVGINKLDEGLRALKAAVALEPDNGIYHRTLGEGYGAQAMQAGVFGMFGLMKSALTEFQKAAQLAPNDVQAHVNLAMFYIMAPGVAGGGLDKAHVEEDALAKLDKVQELLLRAQEAQKNDDPAAATLLFKQAIEQDKTTGSFVSLGIFYTEQKRYDDAFRTFHEAIAKDAKAYGAWYQIGRTAGIAKSNYADGIDALKHYVAFGDDLPDSERSHAWAHLRLGNLYEYQGQTDLARAEYQSANTMNDSDVRLAKEVKKASARMQLK
jgi:tetratricopeptide (TPR) repeat protein